MVFSRIRLEACAHAALVLRGAALGSGSGVNERGMPDVRSLVKMLSPVRGMRLWPNGHQALGS